MIMYQIIPRNVLQNAKGFAIFTVFKAGFLFSARGGSGIVIAKLPNGCELYTKYEILHDIECLPAAWSAPSAIGSAGVGVGGQLGAEMTDFLVVLNSAAVRSLLCVKIINPDQSLTGSCGFRKTV